MCVVKEYKMITLGVYSNAKLDVKRKQVDTHLTECCRGWGDPSPIHYMLYGSEKFTDTVQEWFRASNYMTIQLKNDGTRRDSPRRLSPRIWNLVDKCSHIIIFMHPGSDECMKLTASARDTKSVRKMFSVKVI